MIPVVQIVRVSTEEQAAEGKAGLDRQRHACLMAATRFHLSIVQKIELVGVSGDRVADTPEWQDLTTLLGNGIIRGILVDSTDRLLRATEFDFRVFALLAKLQIPIWTPEGRKDPSDPNDGLLLGILALLGGREKGEIVRRAQAGKEAKRRRGAWVLPLRFLPRGVDYSRESQQWHYTPDVHVVVGAFRRVAAGETIRSVAMSLGMHHQSLRVWLRNEIYFGWLVFDEKRDQQRKSSATGRQKDRPKVMRPPHEVIRIRVLDPPAVDARTWEVVQGVLAGNIVTHRQRKANVTGPDPFPYRGLLYCAGCGTRLDLRYSRSKGHRYHCSVVARRAHNFDQRPCFAGAVKVAVMDEVLARAVSQRLANPNVVARAIHEHLLTLEQQTSDEAARQASSRLASAQAKRSRLLELYLSGGWSQAELDAKRIPLDREIAAAEADISVASQAPILMTRDVAQLSRNLASVFVRFSELEAGERRSLLVALKMRIFVWQEASRSKKRAIAEIRRMEWDVGALLRGDVAADQATAD